MSESESERREVCVRTFSLFDEMRDFLMATVMTQNRAISAVVCQAFFSSSVVRCAGGVRPIRHDNMHILKNAEQKHTS